MSSLFERLAAPQPRLREPARRATTGQRFEMIKRHLETLLNTRQGCSQSSPELGLRDFNGHDLSRGDLLSQVSTDIRHLIHRFEPRIQVRALRPMPNADAPMTLHLRLDCQVRLDNHSELLEIELLVNGHSRYTQVR